MKLLSIVTPTYNRSAYLPRCFESLLAQTDPRFEWIVVDDGSTDGTRETVRAFREQRPDMPIRYIYKENGGKHTALNAAIPCISGDYVLVLDSDDRLVPTAVEEILRGWERYEDAHVGIVIFLKGYSADKPFARGLRENVPLDMFRVHTETFQSRDFCDVFRAEAFKRFPFPEFPGEAFLSESVLWNQMAPGYRIVYINRVLYLAQYLEDGLTKAGRAMRIRMPRGGMYAAEQYMDRRCPVKLRIKNGLLYNCYGYFARIPAAEALRGSRAPLLTVLTRPGGWMLYRYWKMKYGTKK